MSSYEFNIGDTIYIDRLKIVCNIEKELGSGTQGKVYSLICPDNSTLVLKWYFPSMATAEQLDILESLVQKEPPSDRFLWPIALVKIPEKEGFGYIMPLKDKKFVSFSLWLSRKIDITFRCLFTSCFELTQSFHILHSYGLCYRDLSLNNIYFNPTTGEIRIGDTDNIVINGDNRGNIIGTPKFMAPEIITGRSLPNVQSDLFSLSVILFYLLFLNHPLEGKRESSIRSLDLPAMSRLYGFEPLFIFDPKDTSNYPDPIYHKNALIFWNIYPDFFKKMFTRAFTDGLKDPIYGRVRETEWLIALTSLKDLLFNCEKCGSENFFISQYDSFKKIKNDEINVYQYPKGGLNMKYLSNVTSKSNICWNEKCRASLQKMLHIVIDERTVIVLNSDTKLYGHHLDPDRKYNFVVPLGEITRHPSKPNLWGLKNLSENIWKITNADGDIADVLPQKSFLLTEKSIIDFGLLKGAIFY